MFISGRFKDTFTTDSTVGQNKRYHKFCCCENSCRLFSVFFFPKDTFTTGSKTGQNKRYHKLPGGGSHWGDWRFSGCSWKTFTWIFQRCIGHLQETRLVSAFCCWLVAPLFTLDNWNILNSVIRICFGFAYTSLHFFNQSEVNPISWLARTRFPALCTGFTYLLWVLIWFTGLSMSFVGDNLVLV